VNKLQKSVISGKRHPHESKSYRRKSTHCMCKLNCITLMNYHGVLR